MEKFSDTLTSFGNSLWNKNLRDFKEMFSHVIQSDFSNTQNKFDEHNKLVQQFPRISPSTHSIVGSSSSTFRRHSQINGGIDDRNLRARWLIVVNKFYFFIKVPSWRSLMISTRSNPTRFSLYFAAFVCAGLLLTWVPLSLRRLVNSRIIQYKNIIIDQYRLCHSNLKQYMNKISTQVLIAGCGPVGLTLANCLIKSPFIQSIVLLDRKLPSETRNLPALASQRVFSINGPSLRVLQNLNVLPSIRKRGIMSNVQVVSKESQSFVNWCDNEANVIENDELVYGLMKGLKESPHHNKVTFLQDQVSQMQATQNNQHLEIKLVKNAQNLHLETKLLVGSDGINSSIKRLSGITHYGWKYRQNGIVCSMRSDQIKDKNINNNSAYQIYHDGSILALLPLWDQYLSLVWSVGMPEYQYLMGLDDLQFQDKLNNVIRNSNAALGYQKGYVQVPLISQIVNKRLSFPLATYQSSSYTKQRVALVGDAAHTIHPMAGLGVNSGIMDSILLANNIILNLKTGNDIGDLISLSNYQSKAKAFNYKNSLAMQSIKKTFQTDNWMINKIRDLGMQAVQSSSSIKEVLKGAVDDKALKYQWETV